jgi:hypothetical protein
MYLRIVNHVQRAACSCFPFLPSFSIPFLAAYVKLSVERRTIFMIPIGLVS